MATPPSEIVDDDTQPPASADDRIMRRRSRLRAVGAAIVRHPVRTALAVACALAVVACAVVSGMMLNAVRADDHRSQLRASAATAAESMVLKLTSIKAATAQKSINEIRDMSTGMFKDQFDQQAPTVVAALSQSNVDAVGTVLQTGVVSADDRTAEVVTAVNATVKNADAPNGEGRQFRVKVSLVRDQSRWLASNLEFIA